jgi:excisionase family DNA binding protein
MNSLQISLPPELPDEIAQRAAELLAERLDVAHSGDGYLDVAGAAEFLACPKCRIYALVSAGRIPHARDGSRLLCDRQELRDYVEAGGAKRP